MMANFFFTMAPYTTNQDKFNMNAVFHPSPESGMDDPTHHIYKNTTPQRLLTIPSTKTATCSCEDSFAMHRMAAQECPTTPSSCWSTPPTTAAAASASITASRVSMTPAASSFSSTSSAMLFAFLADEYAGGVAYNDMYPANVEPLDPNITEMLDTNNIKWKALLTPGVPLPTPLGADPSFHEFCGANCKRPDQRPERRPTQKPACRRQSQAGRNPGQNHRAAQPRRRLRGRRLPQQRHVSFRGKLHHERHARQRPFLRRLPMGPATHDRLLHGDRAVGER